MSTVVVAGPAPPAGRMRPNSAIIARWVWLIRVPAMCRSTRPTRVLGYLGCAQLHQAWPGMNVEIAYPGESAAMLADEDLRPARSKCDRRCDFGWIEDDKAVPAAFLWRA